MRSITVCLALLMVGCGPNEAGDGTSDAPFIPNTTETGVDTAVVVGDIAGNNTAGAQAIDVYSFEFYNNAVLVAAETLSPAGDKDFFSVEGTAGQTWQFYTSSYFLNGYETIADTVIRIYDADGNLVLENDDMPYRFWETDSGVFVPQTWNGTLYIEVLEWTEWYGVTPAGGDDYTYELWASPLAATEIEPNDSVNEAVATIEAAIVDAYDEVYGPFTSSAYNGTYGTEFYGVCDDDDEDFWAFLTGEDDDGVLMQWSIWPDSTADMIPEVTLYDASGAVLAQSLGESAEIQIDFPFLWDAGLMYVVQANSYYTVGVRNTTAGSSANWYTGVNVGYLASNAIPEAEPNDDEGDAYTLLMEESTTTPGFWSGRVYGNLGSSDSADVLQLVADGITGGVSGKFLSVWAHAQEAGSFLDPHLTIVSEDVEITSLATSIEGNGNDVEYLDYEIPLNNDIFFTISADANTALDSQNSWFFQVYLSDAPLAE